MKNLFKTIALSTALATTASAIPLIDGGVGIGQWAMDQPTGTIQASIEGTPLIDLDLANTAGFSSTSTTYAFAYIEHPIPIIPQVRLEYMDPTFDGNIGQLVYDGTTYASVDNALNLKQFDAVFYYDVFGYLPTSLIPFIDLKFDIGLGAKVIDGSYDLTATGVDIPSVAVSMFMPYAYLNPRVEAFGLGLDVIYKYLGSGGLYNSGMTELSVSLDYKLDFIPFFSPGIEVGYKTQDILLDSSDLGFGSDTSLNLETGFTGIYYGLILEF